MPTTIQIKEDLLKVLNRLKREYNARSYDEVIRELIRRAKRLDKSYFGAFPKLKSFEREEIDRFD
ncbi:MAG TPA: ribbon-helix-helix protein, CopG family [Archaeoglobus veneficus]|nr:MAG: hypothetical protein DRO98_04405 [Archaeoglobales archaeon]HDM60052.1 ribbon-helix-helix protein, CopG family [Archaeoglobus veneficus]